jgi:hypothetical protein
MQPPRNKQRVPGGVPVRERRTITGYKPVLPGSGRFSARMLAWRRDLDQLRG